MPIPKLPTLWHSILLYGKSMSMPWISANMCQASIANLFEGDTKNIEHLERIHHPVDLNDLGSTCAENCSGQRQRQGFHNWDPNQNQQTNGEHDWACCCANAWLYIRHVQGEAVQTLKIAGEGLVLDPKWCRRDWQVFWIFKSPAQLWKCLHSIWRTIDDIYTLGGQRPLNK